MNLWHVVDRTIPRHIVFLGPSAGVWSYSTHSTPLQSQALYLAPIPPPYAHSWMRRIAERRIAAAITSAAMATFGPWPIFSPRDTVNRYGGQKHCVPVPPHRSTQPAVDGLRTSDSAWKIWFHFCRLVVEKKVKGPMGNGKLARRPFPAAPEAFRLLEEGSDWLIWWAKEIANLRPPAWKLQTDFPCRCKMLQYRPCCQGLMAFPFLMPPAPFGVFWSLRFIT